MTPQAEDSQDPGCSVLARVVMACIAVFLMVAWAVMGVRS